MKATTDDRIKAAELLIERASEKGAYEQFQEKYRYDPAGFVQDCFLWRDGEGPSPYQNEALRDLVDKKRICIRGPHGLGKTAMLAWIVLWFSLVSDGEDWKALTTASVWRQLTKFLWPEIKKWRGRIRWDVVGRDPFVEKKEALELSLKLETGEAFAIASNDHTAVEGAHADRLLIIFDESKAIANSTFDAIEGAFSGAGEDTAMEAYAIAVSTPGDPIGRFYDIQSRKAGYRDWHAIYVTKDQMIAAGRMSAKWAEDRRRQWGEESAVYKNRVLGQFANSDEDSVIPLSWIEAANQRWDEWNDAGAVGEVTSVGIDVGRGGDKSVLALIVDDDIVSELRKYKNKETMSIVGQAFAITGKYIRSVVDSIGIGAGVYDRLIELGARCLAFVASAKTNVKDKTGKMGFVNARSGAWWIMRERLDPDGDYQIALIPDDELTGELTAPKYTITSGSKYKVESKDDIRKRIGRSTDSADAVIQGLVGHLFASKSGGHVITKRSSLMGKR